MQVDESRDRRNSVGRMAHFGGPGMGMSIDPSQQTAHRYHATSAAPMAHAHFLEDSTSLRPHAEPFVPQHYSPPNHAYMASPLN